MVVTELALALTWTKTGAAGMEIWGLEDMWLWGLGGMWLCFGCESKGRERRAEMRTRFKDISGRVEWPSSIGVQGRVTWDGP